LRTFGKSFGDIPGKGQASSVLPLSDGGAVVAGYVWNPDQKRGTRALIIRVDKSGKVLWERYLGDQSTSYAAVSIEGDLQRGFFIGGETSSPGQYSSDFWAIHLDADGITKFEGSFGGAGEDTLRDIVLSDSGDWYLVGTTVPISTGSSSSHGWVIKLSREGRKIWSKVLGDNEGVELIAATATSDKGIILSGLSRESFIQRKTDGYLAKLNSAGEILWEKTTGAKLQDRILSVMEDEGGAVLFAGVKDSSSEFPGLGWVQKLDGNGDLIFERTFGFRQILSIKPVKGKGYVVSGITYKTARGDEDVHSAWMAFLDPDGWMKWERILGGRGSDQAYEVRAVDDIGYFLCGATSSFGLSSQQLLLIKLDPLGRSSLEEIWAEDYALAKSRGTIDDFETFLSIHPGSPQADIAHSQIFELEEAQLILLRQDPNQESLQKFLSNRPDTKHARKVHFRIQELDHLDKAMGKDRISAYQGFLNNYPESEFVTKIKRRILNLRLDQAIRNGSLPDLETLLSEAKEEKFKRRCKKAVYQYYKKLDRIEGFEVFLARYPANPNVYLARERLYYLLYLEALEGSVEKQEEFLVRVKEDRYLDSILKLIFARVRRAKALAGYLSFARKYPDSIIGRRALELVKSEIYDRARNKGQLLYLEIYQNLFPHSEQFSEAQRQAFLVEQRELDLRAQKISIPNSPHYEEIARNLRKSANEALARSDPWVAVRKWTLLRDTPPYSHTRSALSLDSEAFFEFKKPKTDLPTHLQLKAFDEGLMKEFNRPGKVRNSLVELFNMKEERKICTETGAWLCKTERFWLMMQKMDPGVSSILAKTQQDKVPTYEWPGNRQPEPPLEMPR
jgi:ribosomal protein L29